MHWVAPFFVALLTGVLGLFCAGLVASACVTWYRVSNFEGAAGYLVVCVAFLGGVAMFFLGLLISRLVASGVEPGFLIALGISWGTVLLLTATTAGVLWLLADIPPRIDGHKLELQVELRLPVGETNAPASIPGESKLTLGSVVRHVQRASEDGSLNLAEARFENGRWTVPGLVDLFTMRGHRSLDFVIGGKSVGGFLIPLPARPGSKYEQWSEWFPNPRPGQPRWPEDKPSCRFRVRQFIPPPPPPDPVLVEAQRFAALTTQAPLTEWLSFLGVRATDERVAAIMKVVEQRPSELAELIRSSESKWREVALAAAAKLSTMKPEIAIAVVAEGNSLAAAVQSFNEMKSDDPEFSNVQIALRTRFSYWHHAWWTVHQLTGVDGRPPVQEILDLAQIRAQETTMDEIVINARAHLNGIKTPVSSTP